MSTDPQMENTNSNDRRQNCHSLVATKCAGKTLPSQKLQPTNEKHLTPKVVNYTVKIDAIIKFKLLPWLPAAPAIVNTRKITGFFVVGETGDSPDTLIFYFQHNRITFLRVRPVLHRGVRQRLGELLFHKEPISFSVRNDILWVRQWRFPDVVCGANKPGSC